MELPNDFNDLHENRQVNDYFHLKKNMVYIDMIGGAVVGCLKLGR